MTDGQCVIGQREHAAHVGYLCRGHLEKLGGILRDIEDEALHLDARPSMAIRTGSGGGSLASERSPARLDVLVHNDPRSRLAGTRLPGPACPQCWHDSCTDIRAWLDAYDAGAGELRSILDVLGSWAALVREERDFVPPDTVTLTGERDLLSRQLEWVAEQPWVDEAYDDLRKLLVQLKGSNGTNPVRKKAVGICPTLLDEGECGGRLWPNEERGDVICDHCSRLFAPEELRHLGQMLIRQGYVEVFRAEWFTGVPAGTIRRWVAEGRCTSEKDGAKLMVQITEVEQLRDRGKRRSVAS